MRSSPPGSWRQGDGAVADKGAPAGGEPKEVLKLSKGEAPGAGGKATQDKVRALEEEIAARDKTIREANERVAKLEKTVKDMNALAELKSKPMADLQKPAVSPPPSAKPAPPPVMPAPATPQPPVKSQPPPATSVAPHSPVETAPHPGPMAASGTQPGMDGTQPKPKSKPKVVEPPPPPPSLVDDLLSEPLYLAAGGGVILLVLGFLGYRILRGRRGGAGADDVAGAEKLRGKSVADSGADSSRWPCASAAGSDHRRGRSLG